MDIGNRSIIRKQNQLKIVDYIVKKKGASRAETAKALSLSKPAASENISDLLEREILVESGIAETVVGKKGTMLRLNNTAYSILIIDITTAWLEHKIQIFLCDLSCKVIHETAILLQSEPDFDNILNQISNWIEQETNKEKVKAIVVSVAGIMKEETEQHLYMDMVYSISCKEAFEQHFGIDTYVYNDVNLMAIGEQQHNSEIAAESLAYLWLDAAVGGGVILDGALYEGAVGGAGEFGFIPVIKQEGDKISINQLHEYISIYAIEKRLEQEFRQSQYLSEIKQQKGSIDFNDFVIGAYEGDTYCKTTCDEIASYVAYGCQAISAVLDLETIILGGHLTKLGGILKTRIEEQLKALKYNKTAIVFAAQERASFYGAGYLGTKKVIESLILK